MFWPLIKNPIIIRLVSIGSFSDFSISIGYCIFFFINFQPKDNKKQVPDIGLKVFDSVEAPKLEVDEKGQISFPLLSSDSLSRIYNMIFTVGLDEPTQVPKIVVEDCIYKIGNHYYITNSEKITRDDYSNAIKNGKVFIDGWTASLNGTLQNYKEDVKIVF